MDRKIVFIITFLVFGVGLLCGCTEESGYDVKINSFQASPFSIGEGDSSTLSWTVEGADSITIDNGIGNIALSGTRDVSPSVTTTYTLTATKSDITKIATVTIQVSVEEEPEPTIIVNMIQANGYVSIQNIEGGSITSPEDITFVTDDYGIIVGYGTWIDVDSSGGVSGGDTITPPSGLAVGRQYTVNLKYSGNIIGSCSYTPPS